MKRKCKPDSCLCIPPCFYTGEELTFYGDGKGAECPICGISSFTHRHKPNTLLKEFERLNPEEESQKIMAEQFTPERTCSCHCHSAHCLVGECERPFSCTHCKYEVARLNPEETSHDIETPTSFCIHSWHPYHWSEHCRTGKEISDYYVTTFVCINCLEKKGI